MMQPSLAQSQFAPLKNLHKSHAKSERLRATDHLDCNNNYNNNDNDNDNNSSSSNMTGQVEDEEYMRGVVALTKKILFNFAFL